MPDITPGEWKFEPGYSGFMGNLEEPPEEPYPPVIYVEEDEFGHIELAELKAPTPDCGSLHPETYEPDREGDENANGRMMAAAPKLYAALNALDSVSDKMVGVSFSYWAAVQNQVKEAREAAVPPTLKRTRRDLRP